MLAKKYKLPIQRTFQKNGKTIKTPYFLFKIFSSDLDFPRFGVIISKKVDPRSSARNKIKRLAMSIVQKYFKNPTANFNNKDFLMIISPKAKTAKKEDLQNSIQEIFNKVS